MKQLFILLRSVGDTLLPLSARLPLLASNSVLAAHFFIVPQVHYGVPVRHIEQII